MRGHLALVCILLLGIQLEAAKKHRRQSHNDVDSSDFTSSDVTVTIYPTEHSVKEGQDVSFECRARGSDNTVYPEVRWTKSGGHLPHSAHESSGRLTITRITSADQGRYTCVATHQGTTYEAHANLAVHSGSHGNTLESRGSCMADEKACGNNECVKADYICDGEPDCRDRSDEANCPALRGCEPNEHRCGNSRCVQKMWLCDGDDDCGDGSDERNCENRSSNGNCASTEFQCHDRQQCVPTSFHCDGTNDCRDGSDEVGCVQPTVVQPPQTNVEVNSGGQFQLTCKAVAVPPAYINWRLNWGPVCEPPRCVQTSEGGTGTLTVNNAQPLDQGAYTCEAINVRGRVLATPDCIVRIVNLPSPSIPTAPPQIVSCDPRGSVSSYPDNRGSCPCKPLVTGPSCNQCRPGSFHLTEKAPQGCLKCFCFGVTDQCRSSSWHRTTDRLMFDGNDEGITLSDIEERNIANGPFEFNKQGYLTTTNGESGRFWRLPQRFLGDKVTSYGGKMEIELEYSGGGAYSNEPFVVLKGNQMILVHRLKNPHEISADQPNRVAIETYELNYEQLNGQPASREDLLTVLADLDAFLIRASHVQSQSSTSLGDVSWEIAVERRTGEGLALEVEMCSCPTGYIGTSCEDCAPGYERSGQGAYLGTCVPIRSQPQPQPQTSCSPSGSIPSRTNTGRCECKTYTTGPNCDQCAANSFHLAPSNPHGCIPCFCSGVTQQCQSSSLSRQTVQLDYRMGEREQLQLSTSDAHSPLSPQTHPFISGRDISFDAFQEVEGQTLYWKLPAKFLGNKVTSYGGTLKYIFKFSGTGNPDNAPDVILRGNDITLHLRAERPPIEEEENTVEVKLFEDRFERVDGQPATREHLLMAMADMDELLIKASYNDDCSSTSLLFVSLEYADRGQGGAPALEVEQCACPPGYTGTSCEDCSSGYSRTGGGLYLGLCQKCECNGHANSCNKEYGYCENCQHNTEGDQCERCKPGFVGEARRGTPHDCQPAQTRPPCQCHNHSPRGCDSFGRCLLCEHNTEGTHCERCKAGYYGDATKSTPYDCTPCPCPGSSDCFLDSNGQVSCRNCPAGLSGRLCNECAPGYTRNTQEGRQCVPIGRVRTTDIEFVPRPEDHQRGQPPQPSVDPPHTTVTEGEAASFRCWVPQIPDCQITWHKEHVGGSLPHGVYQTGNALKIPKAKMTDAGNYICTAENAYGQGRSPPARLDVMRRSKCRPPKTESCPLATPLQPRVDPMEQTVPEGQSARFRCWVPGTTDVDLHWSRSGGQTIPSGVRQHEGILHIHAARRGEHDGGYECVATLRNDPHNPLHAPPARLHIEQSIEHVPHPTVKQQREPLRPQVDPIDQTVNEGDPATFRCFVPGRHDVQIRWSLPNNQHLPHGSQERDGVLTIPRVANNHQGQYLCTAFDPQTRQPYPAPPATLRIAKSAQPMVDPADQTVNEGDPAQIRCWVPGESQAVIGWQRRDGAPLPHDSTQNGGIISFPSMRLNDQGDFSCTATSPDGSNPRKAPNARINVRRPAGGEPMVDPADQTVNEGDPAQIRCWVPGEPQTVIGWQRRDGAPLPHDSTQNGGILSFPSMRLNDQGDFSCTATSPDGSNPRKAPNARINVRRPAGGEPMVDPSDQTVNEGDPAQIKCWVPDEPQAVIGWKRRDGAPLPHDSTQNGGIISFTSMKLNDQGDFSCTATSPDGSNPRKAPSARINVRKPQRIEPQIDPSEQTLPEGKPFKIRCWVPGHPTMEVKWRKVDGEMNEDAKEEGGVISVDKSLLSDGGNYVCSARDPESDEPIDSMPALVNITPAEPIEGPFISPDQQRVPVKDPASIRCWVPGDLDADLTFFRIDGGPLPFDHTVDEGILNIPSAEKVDEGDYICTYTPRDEEGNELGKRNSSISKLFVGGDEEPPTARVEPRVWNGEPGDRHQFNCIVTGNPPPTVTWTAPGGGPLPHDVTQLEDNILDFSNARSELNGEYTCTAVNPIGEASDIGSVLIGPSLTVKTTPAGPRIIIPVGEPLEVKCEAFGDPDPDVEWIHDPGPERGDLPDDFKPITISEQFIKHPSIGLLNAGVYTCKGSNSHATATKNIYIEVVEPQKIATVSILGGSSQWFEEGERGELTCTATGSHLVDRVQWVKVDDQLPTDVEEHNEPGLLHFSNFKKGYAGEYECRGYRHDELIASATVTVHSGSSPSEGEARVSISGEPVRVIQQGDSIQLSCAVDGEHSGSSFEWSLLRGGNLIRRLSSTPKLSIEKADPANDYGVYRCHVEDDSGVVVGSAYTAVTIGYTDNKNAITMKFDDHSDADLLCPVYSVPGSKVEWHKGEEEDLPSNATPNGGKLMIKEFDETSAGMYTCKVTIGEEEVVGYVQAQIFVPDTIIQVMVEVSADSVKVGDRVWFDCKVTGDESAEITWAREEGLLPESSQMTANRLLINEVSESDGGDYKCLATTKAGPLQAIKKLVVESGKRKRKRAGRRRSRHSRHNRRHIEESRKESHSLFGGWFSTHS